MKKWMLTVFLFLALTGPVLAADSKFVLAVQPTASAQALSAQAKELEAFLELELGEDVEILFPTSYAGVVEALRFGHAQAAFLGAWPALLANQKAGAETVLAEIREVIVKNQKTEAPSYYSYWVVLKDSAAQTLADLKGKRAAFPNPLSTSGYVAPMAKLIELGLVGAAKPVDPKTFFGETLFSGGYAQAWEAVKAGQADVTVIAGDVPEKLYHEVLGATRVLETQGPIPSHSVVVSKELTPERREKFVNALLELGTPDKRELMRKFVSGIFVRFEKADASHLEPLRAMLEKTGFEFKDQEKK